LNPWQAVYHAFANTLDDEARLLATFNGIGAHLLVIEDNSALKSMEEKNHVTNGNSEGALIERDIKNFKHACKILKARCRL